MGRNDQASEVLLSASQNLTWIIFTILTEAMYRKRSNLDEIRVQLGAKVC